MPPALKTGFNDRLTAAAEAKKAMLAKFKPKPMIVDTTTPAERAAAREAEREAVRAARAAEKEAARLAVLAAEEAKRLALLEDEAAQVEAQRGARKERKALSKAEAKAKRDARYAARKARR